MFQLYQQYIESSREERFFLTADYVELSYVPQLTLALETPAFLKFIDQRIMEQLGIYGLIRDIQKTGE